MSLAARRPARAAISGSAPRSKRKEASVCSWCFLDVLRMEPASKQALSRKTSVVDSDTPESSPPNTPAMHIGREESAMTISVAARVRSTPSSVTIFSPSFARRTMTFPPPILAASKVCRGCPSSNRMKLEISTTLLMGRRPMASNFCCSHSGDSFTCTPARVMPVYRGAAVASCTSTGISFPAPSAKPASSGRFSVHGMPLCIR